MLRQPRLVLTIAVVVLATVAPRVANRSATMPAQVRSGDRVWWMPDEVASLVRLLSSEGASRVEAAELAQIVHRESRALRLDPLYALALIKIESNFRANAISKRGAVGLLQVRPDVARVIASSGAGAHPGRLRDPQTNVAVGLRYLRHLERQFPDRATALAAYNLGPTTVRHRLEHGKPIPRTYSDRVLATYRALAEAHRASGEHEAPAPRS